MSCDTLCVLPVPGPTGTSGATGNAGANGRNAYTTVASNAPGAQPVMPALAQQIGATLTLGSPIIVFADTSTLAANMTLEGPGLAAGTIILSVTDATHVLASLNATANGATILTARQRVLVTTTTSTGFMAANEPVYVSTWGTLIVQSVPSDTTVYLTNPKNVSLSAYLTNVAPGTSLPAATQIVPTGREGVLGPTPVGAFLVANNLAEGVAATMRTNLALGTVATFAQGNADTNIPRVDLGGGLVAGRALFATVAGVETKVGSAAVATIGAQPSDAFLTSIAALGTAADKTLYTTGVDTAAETTLTAYMRTVLAAIDAVTARGLLGVGAGSTLDYALYRYQLGSGIAGAALPLGAWTIIPFNTEVVDEGNHGTLAAGAVTLAAGTYRYRFVAIASSASIFQGRLTINGAPAANGYGTSGSDSDVLNNLASLGEGVFTLGVASDIRVELFGAAIGTMGTPSNSGGPEIYSSLSFNKE